MHFEQAKSLSRDHWSRQAEDAIWLVNEQLVKPDFVLCASERQRYLDLGQLSARGRVNPDNFSADPMLEKLVAVVPLELGRTAPEHIEDVVEAVDPGNAPGDKLILWSGGIYALCDRCHPAS